MPNFCSKKQGSQNDLSNAEGLYGHFRNAFPGRQDTLRKQFGVPVVNEYGASELDLIAFENRDGEWQVNAETLFVEILDENNQAVPNGTPGRIVITSLFNKAHFLFAMTWVTLEFWMKKALQKPVLKQLIGRTNDVAQLPSGKKNHRG